MKKISHTRKIVTFAVTISLTLALGCGGRGSGGGKDGDSGAAKAAPADTEQRNMDTAYAFHTASLLNSGAVFVVGGVDDTGEATAATTIITNSSINVGPAMASSRIGHTATRLSSGQILIIGGRVSAKPNTAMLNTTTIYDPMTNSHIPGKTLQESRAGHIAVRISDNQVLIVGGANSRTAEIYDLNTSSTNTTLLAAQANDVHIGGTAALLDNGDVLIVGGRDSTDVDAQPVGAERYCVADGSFQTTNLSIRRDGATVCSLGGEAAVVGGESTTGFEASTEIYDMTFNNNIGKFTVGQSLTEARRNHTATVVQNSVVVVGGRKGSAISSTVELISSPFATGTVTSGPILQTPRFGHTATLLINGNILVVGGMDAYGIAMTSIEEFNPFPAPTDSNVSTSAGSSASQNLDRHPK